MKTHKVLIAMVLGLSGLSHAGPENADMPFVGPDRCKGKDYTITIPTEAKGASYYYNRDCSVVYVAPPPTAGTVEVFEPAMSAHMGLCPIVLRQGEAANKIEARLDELTIEESLPTTSVRRLEEIKQTKESLGKRIQELYSKYSNLPGMTVQLQFESAAADYLQAIILANLSAIESGRVKIKAAPVSKSYISFNRVTPGVTKTLTHHLVLESNILGILSNANESSIDRESVRFNGAVAGYVTLNLYGACPIVSGDFQKFNSLKLDRKKVLNLLVATQTTIVPALNTFGYTATFNVENGTQLLLDKVVRNGQFTVNQLHKLDLTGELSEIININSWTYESLEGPQQATYGNLTTLENLSMIKENMLNRYVNKLIQFNLLSEVQPVATPAPGNTMVPMVREECRRSSSWFGFSSSQSCRNVIFQVAVPTDGSSSQYIHIVNQLGLNFSETVEFLHPTVKTHTSVFKFKGK